MGQAWCDYGHSRDQSAEMDVLPKTPLPYHPNSTQNSVKKGSMRNLFGGVDLEPPDYKIILLFSESSPLRASLSQRLEGLTPDYSLASTVQEVQQSLRQSGQQNVVLVDVCSYGLMKTVEELSSALTSQQLWLQATLVALVLDNNTPFSDLSHKLLELGFTRVLSSADCQGDRLALHLKLIERTELQLKQQLMYGKALQVAVEQGSDAVQVIDRQSKNTYVNSSYLNMTGYSREEAVGKPATDILKMANQRIENGPSTGISLKQRWDGEYSSRRKSGSSSKQHLTVIPVSMTPDQSAAMYCVALRRLLNDHQKTTPTSEETPKSIAHKELHNSSMHPTWRSSRPPLTKTNTVPPHRMTHPLIDTPLAKVVHILGDIRDEESCPPSIKEALEKAMDILRTSEPYAPQSDDITRSKGIVQGLLYQSTRRYTITNASEAPVKTSHMSPHLRHSPATPPPRQLQEALEGLDRWNFNIVHLERVCQDTQQWGPLFFAGLKIFKDFNVGEMLGVDETITGEWLKLMESRYHQNPYHNSTHAADVLQASGYIISRLQEHLSPHKEVLEQTEVAAILISAVVHDLDHPGYTNPFLCNSKSDLALLYNDKSVLENHHVSLAFRLTEKNQEANIFQFLDEPTYRAMRLSIIDMVLATDMSQHFEHLTKFNALITRSEEKPGSSTSLGKGDEDSRVVLKRIILKCADISNPCRPMHLCREWAYRIAKEYFKQTAEEKEKGLPIVFPDFDVTNEKKDTVPPITQIKFMDFFITGLFEAWDNYCPIPELMDQLSSNYDTWKNDQTSPVVSEGEQP